MNLQERYLTIRDYIDSENTGKVIDEIIKYNNEDIKHKVALEKRQPIHLHIQSQGGNTLDAFALIDIMLTSDTPIYSYADGYVESAAVDIFLAGSKRLTHTHTMFLIHGTSSCAENMKLPDMKSHINMLTDVENWGKSFLIERTLLSQSQIEDLYTLNKDIFFASNKALSCGIATHII